MAKKTFKPEIDYEADSIMIGISCHLKDYRLVHYLNKNFHLNLIRFDDLEVLKEYDKVQEKYLPQKFPFYYYLSEEDYIAYNFIVNFSDDGRLLNEQKTLDYVLIINGAIENYNTKPIIDCLKQIPNVLTVVELKTETLKNLRPIFEDMEVHILEHYRKLKEEEQHKKLN